MKSSRRGPVVIQGWDRTEVLDGRAAIGYDHGYDAEKFYLELTLNPKYIKGFVEGCLERIGEDNPEDEAFFRGMWDDEDERETVLRILKQA